MLTTPNSGSAQTRANLNNSLYWPKSSLISCPMLHRKQGISFSSILPPWTSPSMWACMPGLAWGSRGPSGALSVRMPSAVNWAPFVLTKSDMPLCSPVRFRPRPTRNGRKSLSSTKWGSNERNQFSRKSTRGFPIKPWFQKPWPKSIMPFTW